jgi:hypothetical protein
MRRIVTTRLQAGCGERLSPGLWSWHSRRTETTMSKSRSLVASLVVALAFGFVGAACGGDDGGPLQAQTASGDNGASDVTSSQDTAAGDEASNTTAAEDQNNAEDAATSESDAGSNGGGNGDTPPQLAQGSWEGTLHFEVSGDVDLSADMPGGGLTQGAFSLLTFAAADNSGTSQIAFTAGSETEAAIFVSSNGFTSGGEIGKECSLSTSTNDETKVEGSFSCKGATGIKAASLDDLVVDIEGTFTMTRP